MYDLETGENTTIVKTCSAFRNHPRLRGAGLQVLVLRGLVVRRRFAGKVQW